MKGVFESKLVSSLPRYTETWDVNIVICYLTSLGPPAELKLKVLMHKVVMLLALLSGQRRQTLHALDINHIKLTADQCVFTINTLLKTSRVSHHQTPIKLLSFNSDISLCVVKHLFEYIHLTASLRGNQTKLFISYQKPYKAVSAIL